MVLISFKSAKTKKHIANFRFSYQIQSVVHYVDYLSEDITQGLFVFLASKRLRLPISSERNRPFLRKERKTHISSERIRFGYLPWNSLPSVQRFVAFKAFFKMKVSIDNTKNVNKNVDIFLFFL